MPIDPVHLQRRHAEQGRIRLGHKTGEKGRPAKLEAFRFTSPNRALIEALAELYGGEAQAWDNAGLPEWEVYSTATSLPVIVVKGGVSQWFEHWTAAGIGHRCDGSRQADGTLCREDDPAHVEATKKPTTRLSVMLPELDSTGVWRMETHGWNAAAEIPMLGELAAHVGSMVPARLSLVERRKVIQVNGKPTTSRFVVPMIDLEINVRDLAQIVSGTAPAQIEQAAAKEIGPGTGVVNEADILDLYADAIAACQTQDEVSTLWRQITMSDHLYPLVKEALTARGQALAPPSPPETPARPTAREEPRPATPASPAGPGEEDAVVVEDLPPGVVDSDPLEDDRAWQDVISAAGKQKLSPMEVMSAFVDYAGHTVEEGNAAEFRAFMSEVLEGKGS